MPKAAVAPAPLTLVPARFVPPAVEIGQAVLWSDGAGDGRPAPALVLAVGAAALTLAVHMDGIKDHVIRTGVRHQADPFVKTAVENHQGVWRLTPRDERLDALLERFGAAGED